MGAWRASRGRSGRRQGALLLGLLAILVGGAFAGAEGELPAELREGLDAMVARYREAANRFHCQEVAYRFDEREGRGGPDGRATIDYLLVQDPGELWPRADRRRPGVLWVPRWVRRARMPEPYVWPLLFDPSLRGGVQLSVSERAVGEHGRMTCELRFTGCLLPAQAEDPRAWSGTLTLDLERWEPIRLRARPALDEETALAQHRRHRRSTVVRLGLGAPRFGQGLELFRFARPAQRQELEVRWAPQRDGLSYPAHCTLTTGRTAGIGGKDTAPRRRLSLRYEDYEFFAADAEEAGERRAAPAASPE